MPDLARPSVSQVALRSRPTALPRMSALPPARAGNASVISVTIVFGSASTKSSTTVMMACALFTKLHTSLITLSLSVSKASMTLCAAPTT